MRQENPVYKSERVVCRRVLEQLLLMAAIAADTSMRMALVAFNGKYRGEID